MDTVTVTETIRLNGLDHIGSEDFLGSDFIALHYEQNVFQVATRITQGEYSGGFWEMKLLSNGGFFYCLRGEDQYICHNPAAYWQGNMAPEPFSLAVSLYVSSELSFVYFEKSERAPENSVDQKELFKAAQRFADNYHLLRDYLMQDDGPFSSEEITAVAMCTD